MTTRRIALVVLGIALLTAGCLNFRGKPRPAANEPEFRGASEQNGQQGPLPITPPPQPKVEPTVPEESALRRLANSAAERKKSLNAYYVRIRRRENVNGKDQPEEIILFKYRRAPMSIHCKWLGKEGLGREIIYVKGSFGDKIHILSGEGDLLGA